MGARRLTLKYLTLLCASLLGLSAGFASSAVAASPPSVDAQYASDVRTDAATLNAQVNPSGSDATYRFEYGTSTSYGAGVPVPDADIGSGSEDVTVHQRVEGLQPGTAYHYRVRASSEGGTSEGADHLFRTYPVQAPVLDSCPNASIRVLQFSSYLPDCRGYELVSPSDKSGADIAADPTFTQSAASGEAIKFDSLNPFGDSQGVEARGAEYVAQRGADGWSTHGINPEQDSPAFGAFLSSSYVALSEDLSKGVFFARSPVLPGHPNVEKAENLYLREDMLAGPPGAYQLLSDSINPLPAYPPFLEARQVGFAAASADWKHVLFETSSNLTAEASGLSTEMPKAYEWDEGVVRLVGILPDGTPAEGSVPGRGAGAGHTPQMRKVNESWNANAISSDGSRVIFEAAPLSFGYGPGTTEERPAKGSLYMRINHLETIKLDVSERTGGPPPGESADAMFVAATQDDSQVFFVAGEDLTDEAALQPSGAKLYRYKLDAPAGHHLTLISVNANPEGKGGVNRGEYVVGLSADGSYVYFTGRSDLLPGLPPTDENENKRLYLWHDGAVRYVADHEEEGAWIQEKTWGEGGISNGNTFRVGKDGKTILFLSRDPKTARRVGYDNVRARDGDCYFDSCYELYTYNADTDQLHCVSCDPSGARPVSEPSMEEPADGYVLSRRLQYLNRALSSDGRLAFFDTADALVPQDTNGRRDAYEYDVRTGEVHLISSGVCGCGSYFVDASADGSNAFFTTRQRLVTSDFDTNSDMYDARIEGGILSQNVAPPARCEGDDCQGPAKSAPALSLPASATFSGVGNPPLVASKPAVKSKHKVKGKHSAKSKKRAKGKKKARRHKQRGRRVGRKSSEHAVRRAGR